MNLVKVIIEELRFEDYVTGPQESFRKNNMLVPRLFWE